MLKVVALNLRIMEVALYFFHPFFNYEKVVPQFKIVINVMTYLETEDNG